MNRQTASIEFDKPIVRESVAAARGGKSGAKANAKTVSRHLDALVKSGAVSRCEIETARGNVGDGYRLRPLGGRVRGRRLAVVTWEQNSFDEFLNERGTG